MDGGESQFLSLSPYLLLFQNHAAFLVLTDCDKR